MKFNPKKVDSLKPDPEKDRNIVWEDGSYGLGNLGIRISKTGRKSWVYMYRYGGKSKMLTFGQYPKMSVGEAHEIYTAATHWLEKGYDPSTKNLSEASNVKKSEIIEDLSKKYLKYVKSKCSPKTYYDYKGVHDRDILPVIGRMKAKTVTKDDLERILKNLKKRKPDLETNRVYDTTRVFFNYLVKKDFIDFNPLLKVDREVTEKSRERTLWDDDIISFLRNLGKCRMEEKTRIALRLQLHTGQRPGEIASIEWKEIDFRDRWWVIPGEKTKNKREHHVPLTEQMLKIFNEAKLLSGDSEWVFPSSRNGGKNHILENSFARAVNRNLETLKVEHFTPHDLRRTVTSHLAKLKVRKEIRKKVLNHVDGDVTDAYDRYDFSEEKREALEKWNAKLDRLLAEARKKEQEDGEA